ncbi:conserved hypothetical protein [Pediculus humanus corporis]|uniref:Uncharacterized protein n=1 Tax=Pediculus humanus subsp. corporis TaxID=121224 RepID=E0VZ43_PEDHC|nr:uncharacterized protein Phum_PHUM524540 [Pediculus humanus corporis]EEB18649.1 conserved hypothetical protein [Pediculus humanus corporis]
MNTLWNGSLSSTHGLFKILPNKDDYENIYETETINNQTNGFNTLPILKKKNQTRLNEVFTNEPFTAYFFSSAENLGCSTSNIQNDNATMVNDNLPPRIYLTGNQINKTTANKQCTEVQNNSSHLIGRTDGDVTQHLKSSYDEEPHVQQQQQVQKKTNLKKINDKDYSSSPESEQTENVITFHYRVGIPRSPNIQNFNKFSDKDVDSWQEGNSRRRSGDDVETRKNTKKYFSSKDSELLQKHNSLIKEFNKTLDSEIKNRFSKNYNDSFSSRFTGSYTSQNHDSRLSYTISEPHGNDEYLLTGNLKTNENESDVYFGDISNSSCYGPESLMQDDVIDNDNTTRFATNNGRSFLNKQNLKMIENDDDDEENGGGRINYTHHRQSSSPSPGGVLNLKYFTSPSVRGLQDSERMMESTNSNDELSSSTSMTADSGISSGKNYLSRGYDNGFDNLGTFAHPLFQKPKVLPRLNTRYADPEGKKDVGNSTETTTTIPGNNELDTKKKFLGKVKKFVEDVDIGSNQLLSTCNLTLSSRYMTGEDGHQFVNNSNKNNDDEEERMRGNDKEEYGDGMSLSSESTKTTTTTGNNKIIDSTNGNHGYNNARPLHLQEDLSKKFSKSENLLQVQGASGGRQTCDVIRPNIKRRRNILDVTDVVKDVEIGIHSVNV